MKNNKGARAGDVLWPQRVCDQSYAHKLTYWNLLRKRDGRNRSVSRAGKCRTYLSVKRRRHTRAPPKKC